MGTVLGIGTTPTLCTTAMGGSVREAGNALSTHPTTLGSRGAGALTANHGVCAGAITQADAARGKGPLTVLLVAFSPEQMQAFCA